MLTMKNLQTKKRYDLVTDDGYDSRIPLHNEEAFQHGLHFQAKYIGTLDVPRPSSRVEIVAAMRRIRFEFKAKAIKKKKVNISVSTEGVKVTLAKRQKKQTWLWDDSHLLVMQHPIYRIFYVSHDSQDLKIFSYIARDGSSNIFKCNVFKAYKKNQAMRIVRTIGQAFEVCHKMNISNSKQIEDGNEAGSEKSSEDCEPKVQNSPSSVSVKTAPVTTSTPKPAESTLQSPQEVLRQAQTLLQTVSPKPGQVAGTISSPSSPPLDVTLYQSANTSQPLSVQHQLQLLQQQLEQQTQQTQIAISQVNLLKNQLATETAARIEAQARTHQLLVQNRELLEHINILVGRLQYLEVKVTGTSQPQSVYRNTQNSALPDAITPEPGSLYDAKVLDGLSQPTSAGMFENANVEFTESPDSGHREMSSDSLAFSNSQSEVYAWYVSRASSATGSCPTMKHSVSSYSYTPGSLSANNRPELNLPLRSSSNPFTVMPTSAAANNANTANYENIEKKEPQIITPMPMQDACGNQLDLRVTPKLDPPPKVNRRSNRTSVATPSTTSITSPDSNGNNSTSRCSTTSENSFEMHLNQLLEQASLSQNNITTDNITNERKELNTEQRTDNNLNKANMKLPFNVQRKSPLIEADTSLRKPRRESFSDEENTEEIEDPELRCVLKGDELKMFSEL